MVALGLAAVTSASASAAPATGTATAQAVTVVDPSASGVTADALPTAQIDGVVWSQAVLGDTVYAGGKFANARPAGSAPGVDTVPRSNLLAYSISTGVLNPTFAPVINAQVKAVALSPDGTTLYIGGDFTQVNGVNRYRVAAFDTASGNLITSFAPKLNSTVGALAATNSTLYVGGFFSTANGVARARVAAFAAGTGALTTWDPEADYNVNALVVTPDGSRVIAGGGFKNMNGQPAYGLAALDPTSGSLLTWNAANTILDAGSQAAILSLNTDGTSIFGTGYVYGVGGNFEGTFSADPDSGTLNWLEDCHGDTYSSFATGGQVYVVAHEHYCGNIGGFGETLPRTWHRATAFTNSATGTATADPYGYASFTGQPTPSLVNWFPDPAIGTYTGQNQAAWSVTGNSTYVVLGGEFPSVNGVAQQGLVRFASKPTAPSKQGPMVPVGKFTPRIVATSPTSINLRFQASWDRDDTQLSYSLVMNNATTTPIWTGTIASTFWNRPVQSVPVSGLTVGKQYVFRLSVSDPSGNTVAGANVVYTPPPSTSALSTYQNRVLADGATSYYPLDDPTGTTSKDYVGFNDGVNVGTVLSTPSGAIAGDAGATLSILGTGIAQTGTTFAAPSVYTEQAWIRTSALGGGPIMEFGNGPAVATGSHDREVYMRPDGRVEFTIYTGTAFVSVVSTSVLNDGQWHQITATEGDSGITLYVDGVQAATATGRTAATLNYTGMWRLGAENLVNWPSAPLTTSLVGDVDEWAIYPTALSSATVQAQYVASGRGTPAPTDAYGAGVYAKGPFTYWRLDDATTTTAADASGHGNTATYKGGVTLGATGAVTNNPDTAAQFDGSTGYLAGTNPVVNPSVFSEEAWIKTTTTSGGTIVDLGDSQTGPSTNHDRALYMTNDGRVSFQTNGSTPVTITSSSALNDGRWHHLAATSSTAGVALYVDGVLAANNPQGGGQNFTGYWRVGGDSLAGVANQPASGYFAGTIDEVALYPYDLSASQVAADYTAGGQVPPPAAVNSFMATLPFNNVGVSPDSNPNVGNIDGSGSSFSAEALAAAGVKAGSTITAGGQSFLWPATAGSGSADNVQADGQTIALNGTATTLGLLVTCTYGSVSGTATVNYANGARQTFTLSCPDWWSGTSAVISTAYLHRPNQSNYAHAAYVYYVGVSLTGAPLSSVVLPARTGGSSALHVFAITATGGRPVSTVFATNAVPNRPAVNSTAAVAIGSVFSSTVAAKVVGIRFYKGAGNNGPHTVTLWSSNGTALATATTVSETTTGWQSATFTTPVVIAAGTTYEVSYWTSAGYWSEDDGGLASAVTNGPLTIPANGGRYNFSNGFPTGTYANANFWVDPLVTVG